MRLNGLLNGKHSFAVVLGVSAALRIALILYSEWHDQHSIVKYTDIDYRVFTDAAKFLLDQDVGSQAKGPLGIYLAASESVLPIHIGDPYTRETYRYTPLLALLLTPNIFLHPSFGKYIFSLCDLVNGVIIYLLLASPTLGLSSTRQVTDKIQTERLDSTSGGESVDNRRRRLALIGSSLHLLNPMVFSISTRGSSESVLCTLVLVTLYTAMRGYWDLSAIMLGISTHWKIYPVIYGVSCLGVITSINATQTRSGGNRLLPLWNLVNGKTIRFVVLSAGTFFVMGVACYMIWGYPFLYESYLYHLHRLDHRHNFSPYFYLTYLTYPSSAGRTSSDVLPLWSRIVRSSLISFAPQMTLAAGSGLLFGRRKEHLPFAWFVQTFIFVLFNKVCTSQYFLWYLLFLPFLIARLSTSLKSGLTYLGVWVGTQALWLSQAYRLEFLGENVFFRLWICGLIYVIGNTWVLGRLITDYVF